MSGIATLGAAAWLAAVELLSVVPPASTESSVPERSMTRAQICYTLATDGAYPPLSAADCLRFETAPVAVFKTKVCGYLRESEQLRDYHFSSLSDCIEAPFGQ